MTEQEIEMQIQQLLARADKILSPTPQQSASATAMNAMTPAQRIAMMRRSATPQSKE